MNKAMPPLPRQLNSDSPDEMRAVIRQIVDYLRALPRFEIKKVEMATEVSHTLKTNVRHPVILLRGQAYKTESVDESVVYTALPDWRPTADGLRDRVDTSGVKTTMVYLIIGEGE